MPANQIVIGAKYQHDRTGNVMRLAGAEMPEKEDPGRVYLQACDGEGFWLAWRGTVAEFKAQWTWED
jgi:hypothetical protein